MSEANERELTDEELLEQARAPKAEAAIEFGKESYVCVSRVGRRVGNFGLEWSPGVYSSESWVVEFSNGAKKDLEAINLFIKMHDAARVRAGEMIEEMERVKGNLVAMMASRNGARARIDEELGASFAGFESKPADGAGQ